MTLTLGARRATLGYRLHRSVLSRAELTSQGAGRDVVAANLRSARWRAVGLAVITHTGPLSVVEQRQVALINCGPRAALASFTAASAAGLRGWEREEIHVLVPQGARIHRTAEMRVMVHQIRDWAGVDLDPTGRRQRLAPALIMAAGSMRNPRPACAILAAAAQQRLTKAGLLQIALDANPRVRHRALLRAAVDDVAMGAQALSEIDFVRICRRHHLPAPRLQSVRQMPGGRRRYLDAEWERSDGRRVIAEVDGALHLRPLDWVDDQIRQNELVLQDALILRFPTVIVRTDETLVAHQLRRALALHL